jgi:hypothetical protein
MKRRWQTGHIECLRFILLEVGGWLIPLVVSATSLFIWTGLMTVPLVVYLMIMCLSLFVPAIRYHGQEPSVPYLVSALDVLLLGGPHIPDRVISLFGISLMVYATVYLRLNRKQGLVTSGPYRLVRHPQYFGAVLFTLNLTSRSYREVLGDVGWLSPWGTLMVWFGTLGAYVLLALIEEAHLSEAFGEEYDTYRRRTALLIPCLVTGQRRSVEIVFSMVVPIMLLCGLVLLNRAWYP